MPDRTDEARRLPRVRDEMTPKKVFIKTWGCQMNVYDSGRMADVARTLGYEATDDAAEADLVILNTCHIREKATEKMYSDLGRLHRVQKARRASGKDMRVAVAGCVAQAEGAGIFSRAPYVDLVFGPQSYDRLPAMLARASRKERVLETEFPAVPKFDNLPAAHTGTGVSAFLAIQEGCDRFCSYCVVPYTRGAEYSRPAEAIEAEARRLVEEGAREITLLGQNVNAYRFGLANIIKRIAVIPALARIRYTTSHPCDMGDDLIAAHRDIPKLMPYLHLPAQSGSDRILAAMNRKHTVDAYCRVVEKLRAARPDLALSTDFIVGFPGETDADFEATMNLARNVGFAQAYSFKYSRRPGTPAASLDGQLDEAAKDERLQALQDLLLDQQKRFNRSCVGKTLPVLFENPGRAKNTLFGRTPYLQGVRTSGPARLAGQEAMVKMEAAGSKSLKGTIVKGP